MRSYILFENDDQILVGTLPECCEKLKHYDKSNIERFSLIIMLPHPITYFQLSKKEKEMIMRELSLSKRINLNNQLKNKYRRISG